MLKTKTKWLIKKVIACLILSASIFYTTSLADDYMYVKASHLNVRDSKLFRGKIIAVIDSWYKVTVLETLNNGWKRVLLENWQEGYVNGKYLVEEAPYYEKAQWSKYTVVSPRVFVRWDNIINKIAVLHKWDMLETMSEKIYLSKWVRVKITSATISRYNWRIGYIAKQLVKVVEWTEYSQTSAENVNLADDSTFINNAQSNSDSSFMDEYINSISNNSPELNSAPEEDPEEEITTTDDEENLTNSWSEEQENEDENEDESEGEGEEWSDSEVENLLKWLGL